MHQSWQSCFYLMMLFVVGSCLPDAARAQLEYPGDVDILGPEEIVFNWSADSCEQIDIPDAPARAFRDADGMIQLIAPHYTNYRMIGPDFNSLVRDCSNGPILSSHFDGDPAKYNDHEWIVATYTTDGKNIFAIIHDEYHALDYPGQAQCNSGNALLCWYNALTLATSTDTGRTYTHATAPNHLIAAAPYQYAADQGPFGVFGGTNIVYNKQDGYYYVIVQVEAFGLQQVGVTPMRTQDLSDPTSWRGWDGTGYTVPFVNPYTQSGFDPADHVVQPIGNGNIEKMQGSLSWSTYFNKWLVVGAAQKGGVWGFYYSISDDLINWVTRKLIMTANVLIDPNHSTTVDVLAYPSVIDHADTTRNFEQIGQEAYLYFTRIHPTSLYDRDLVRVPIRFNKLLVDGWEVTGKGDLEDKNVGDGVCETSAGLCSFRAAVQEANARIPSWADSVLNITFNIAAGTGVRNIKLNSALQNFWYPVHIDGYTQPGATPNTNAFGQAINAQPMIRINCNGNQGLGFEGGNSTVKGLIINQQMGAAISLLYGDNNVIQGNYLNTDETGTQALSSGVDGILLLESSNNLIGDTTAAGRNLIVGDVRIKGPDAANNTVQGNYLGTDISGTVALNTWGGGVTIEQGAQNNTIGGTSAGARNLISGNNSGGVTIDDTSSSGNVVINNYIGVDVTGGSPLGNSAAGVTIRDGAEGNYVGQPGYGNVICDNSAAGLWIENSSRNFVFGNFIGTNEAGASGLGNKATGIFLIGNMEEMSIGGANAGEGNTIAYNAESGVAVMGNVGNGVKIWSNSIFRNGGLGIDLGFDGWTGNDAGDGDPGPNGTQNFPVLETAVSGNLLVSGSLNSTPGTIFRIEFFESDTCDPSGYGEGKTYLDAIAVTTDANGDASFSVQLNQQVADGRYITATASAPDNSTSEFSNCVQARAPQGSLTATPATLATSLNAGDSTDLALEIRNVGTAQIDWSLSWTSSWLSVSPVNGSLAIGGADSINVAIDATGLSAGSFRDTVRISSSEPNQADILVPIDVSVVQLPNIEITPDSLSFTLQPGAVGVQQMVIKNTGQATLNFTIGTTFFSQWLSVSIQSGSLQPGDSAVVDVTANSNSVAPGVHAGALIVNSNDPDEGNINPPVSLRVIGNGPHISVVPDSLYATLNVGASFQKELLVENVGSADLTWSLQHNASWLSVSAVNGVTSTTQVDTLDVVFDATGLTVGTYTDTLTITHNDADTPPLQILARLTVTSESPVIAVTQKNLVGTQGPGQSQTHSFLIGNEGNAELQWSITWQASWIDATPTSGSTAPANWQEIIVTVDATGLTGGEYLDSLLVSSTDPVTPLKKVYVYLTVTSLAPDIFVSQDQLGSVVEAGESYIHPLMIENRGNATLSWTISKTAAWVEVHPDAAITAPGSSDSVEVWLKATDLTPGVYRDTLKVQSNDPDQAEIRVAVELNVQAPTSVTETGAVPTQFSLMQNYPNPFNPSTMIQYSLPEAADIELSIFDIAGRHVRTLVAGERAAGRFTTVWDGKDRRGLQVSSGMYFYTLSGRRKTGEVIRLTRKMLFLK